MYDIMIDGTSYPLRFGMGFVKDMNRRNVVPVKDMPGVEQSVGLQWCITEILDGDLEALEALIFCANRTENPKFENIQILDRFFEDENTDIEEVKNKVLGFCRSANCTKLTMHKVDQMYKEYQQNQQNQ